MLWATDCTPRPQTTCDSRSHSARDSALGMALDRKTLVTHPNQPDLGEPQTEHALRVKAEGYTYHSRFLALQDLRHVP